MPRLSRSQVFPSPERRRNSAPIPPMQSRRPVAIAVIAALCTALLIIYESSPAPGAPHSANLALLIVCGIALAVCVVWFVFDPALGRQWHRLRGRPYAKATCERQTGGSWRLSLERFYWFHVGGDVECRVYGPAGSGPWWGHGHLNHQANRFDLVFPTQFQPAPELKEGKYRVRWRAATSDDPKFLSEVVTTSFRVRKS